MTYRAEWPTRGNEGKARGKNRLFEQSNALQRQNAQYTAHRDGEGSCPTSAGCIPTKPRCSCPKATHRGTTSTVLQMCSLQIILNKVGHETNEPVILDPLSMASCTRIKGPVLSLSQDRPHPIMRTIWSKFKTEWCPVVGTVAHDLTLWEDGPSRPWQFHLPDHRTSTVSTMLGQEFVNRDDDCIDYGEAK